MDEAISILEKMKGRQCFNWFCIVQVIEMLKNALSEAEDAYIAYIGREESIQKRIVLLPAAQEPPEQWVL